jgi:hypothetical protein
MKTLQFNPKTRDTLHVEVPGCIINVHVGLQTQDGQNVTRVDIKCDDYPGEDVWRCPDFDNAEFVGVRVMRMPDNQRPAPEPISSRFYDENGLLIDSPDFSGESLAELTGLRRELRRRYDSVSSDFKEVEYAANWSRFRCFYRLQLVDAILRKLEQAYP